MAVAPRRKIRIAHVLFRFAVGGLENGVANLINHLPEADYQHSIICLTDYDPEFHARIETGNTDIHCLHKRDGKDLMLWWRLYRLLRELSPDILHTRNFNALEYQIPGLLAGVGYRIHGEHGWDVQDMHGSNDRYRLARRLISPFVHRFIALSREIEAYLRDRAGIAPEKISQIYNGVDTGRFHPPQRARTGDRITIGTVGRMKTVKNQTLLARAFIALIEKRPELKNRIALLMLGDGPLRAECLGLFEQAGISDCVSLPGEHNDIAGQMRNMDIFVLPSLAEGVSNTILEAMATGLPVIATRVGGNPELVEEGASGQLIDSDHDEGLVSVLEYYIDNPDIARQHGARGRELVEQHYSMQAMVDAYDSVYRSVPVHAPLLPPSPSGRGQG